MARKSKHCQCSSFLSIKSFSFNLFSSINYPWFNTSEWVIWRVIDFAPIHVLRIPLIKGHKTKQLIKKYMKRAFPRRLK